MERSFEHVESISLKKHCIDGSIRYMMYKKLNMRTEMVSDYELADIDFNGKDGKIKLVVAVSAGNSDGYGFYVYFITKRIKNTKEEYEVSEEN
ncbi:MAG: hypothetical protein K2L10_07385 [Ruminococcus sp.]|nr:hypothetical protein [Ruminococcus sp.]